MGMREKLIKLLGEVQYLGGLEEKIADHLIANGVTIPVRCEGCKWYKEGELLAPNKFCFRLKHPTEDRNVGYNFCDDDFCSYGERKDNEAV